MKAKIVLEDGTEFEVGEEIEHRYGGNSSNWAKIHVSKGELGIIAECPHLYRKLAPKVNRKVPRTMREIDDIINVKRYEWRGIGFADGCSSIGGSVTFNPHNNDCISVESYHADKTFFRVNECSPWQPLAEKEVEE